MKRINIDLAWGGPLRYPTLGDYSTPDNGETIDVTVAETGDWRFNFLVAIHETIEAVLCRHAGIEFEKVDAFDFPFYGAGEPGDNPAAPYHKQHAIASNIEFQICQALGLDWNNYEAVLGHTFDRLYPETVTNG